MNFDRSGYFFKISAAILVVLTVTIGYMIFKHNDIILLVLTLVEGILLSVVLIAYSNSKNDQELEKAENVLLKDIERISVSPSEIEFSIEQSGRLFNVCTALENMLVEMKKREKMREEVLRLVNTAASNVDLSKMLAELIPKLATATGSEWGAFYQANELTNKLELKYSIGFGRNIYSEFDITIGEGFIGMAALIKKVYVIEDIPDDTAFVTRTVLGKIKPKNLMHVPILNQEHLLGVVVLGSIYEFSNYDRELMEFINYYLGLAIGNGITYERASRLTKELQFQNKLIQNLNEELEYKVRERTTHLKSVMDAIVGYAIFAVDNDYCITSWNLASAKLFGYDEIDIMGDSIYDALELNEEEIQDMERNYRLAKLNGSHHKNGWRNTKGGKKRYIEMFSYAMYNEKTDFIGIVTIAKEVPEEEKSPL